MSTPSQSYTRNLLLTTMEESDFALLQPHLVRVELQRRDPLFEPDQPIEAAHFLESGVASIVSEDALGEAIEVGILGREGVSGIPLLLGSGQGPHRGFMQIGPGSALRIDAEPLIEAMERSPSLRTLLLRFVQTFMVQLAQTLSVNGNQTLPERLARWLLMCHDRLDGD